MMKYFYIFFLSFYTLGGHSQSVMISNPTQNKLFLGIENPLDICITNSQCKDLTFKVSQGEIRKEDCKLYIKPNTIGTINIEIYLKNRLIDTKELPVILLEPYIKLRAPEDVNGNLMTRKAFRLNIDFKEIHIGLNDVDFKCQVLILRGSAVLYNEVCRSLIFTEEFKSILKGLLVDDIVIFRNGEIIMGDNILKTNDLSFSVQ